MRTLNKFLTISAMAFLIMLMAPHKSIAQGYVSSQEFYDDLQDYGTWIQDDQYGDVWVPDVDGDFRPYATNGHWVQTDYGTTWVSDYPWGWATFHYGRWRFDDYYGWEWIPGHEWAPAWVTWRQGGGYYSWAPIQPGISISIILGSGYYMPNRFWICAPQAYITSPYINRYYVADTRAINIIHNTTFIRNTYVYNNRTYITGPRPRDIEQATHKRVTVYHIGNADRPGTANFNRNTVNFYKPEIKVTPDARPRRVIDARAYRAANPHNGIGKPGATINVHINAAKLAATARGNNPKIVHINPVPVHPEMPGEHKNVGPVLPANDTKPAQNHPAVPDGHKNVGPVNPVQQQPAEEVKHPRKVAPAVMPPADHHDPTVRQTQPADQQKHQANVAAKQQKPKADAQEAQQQKIQQQAAQQAQQQVKTQAQQAAQQQKAQQQQAAQQARQQAQQQAKAQAQQQKIQQQQAAQQARQQAQQQAKAQAQQAAQQQKVQQQQAAQQARQQTQQQQKLQQQQAQQQQRQQQQAAKEAAQKQKEHEQQNPPGN